MTPNPNPSPELKACPFCGSPASIETEKRCHAIMCLNPDCGEVMTRWLMSAEEAATAWNTRALSPQTLPAPGEVERDVEPVSNRYKLPKCDVCQGTGKEDYAYFALEDCPRCIPTVAAANDEGVADDELDCEFDDGEYSLTWPTGEWLVAHPNGKITVGISPRGDTQPYQTTIATIRLLSQGGGK